MKEALPFDTATLQPRMTDTFAGEPVHDPDRFHYIQHHLDVIADMIESGIDIRGYICRTLLDNFEWAEGCSKRF